MLNKFTPFLFLVPLLMAAGTVSKIYPGRGIVAVESKKGEPFEKRQRVCFGKNKQIYACGKVVHVKDSLTIVKLRKDKVRLISTDMVVFKRSRRQRETTEVSEAQGPAWYEGLLEGFSGKSGVDVWYFPLEALNEDATDSSVSLKLQPEYRKLWSGGESGLTSIFFYRYDFTFESRTHFDVRELLYYQTWSHMNVRLGVGRETWGVMEFMNPTDIINQRDLLENPFEKEKLGQPLAAAGFQAGNHELSLYVLPYFRTATFPESEDRIQFSNFNDDPEFQSDEEEEHVDFAARLAGAIDVLDYGLSYFQGTRREPELRLRLESPTATPELVPYYPQIRHTGLSLQVTLSDLLLKTELTHIGVAGDDYRTSAGGLEYNLYQFIGGTDLTLFAEYFHDTRDDETTVLYLIPLQDDLIVSNRLALNDLNNSEIIAGVSRDLEFATTVAFFEFDYGWTGSLRTTVRYFGIVGTNSEDVRIYPIRRDNLVSFELSSIW